MLLKDSQGNFALTILKKIIEGIVFLEDMKIVSRPTIDRLFLCYRTLCQAQQELQHVISSEELGERLGVTSEIIRKDLAFFGKFGRKGKGYYVDELIVNVKETLGLDNSWNIALVGAGDLGNALANYHNFSAMGFNLVDIFDVAPTKVGSVINGITVSHIDMLEALIQEKNIHIGIITVPQCNAQGVANKLVSAGVRGIWNFSPITIKAPSNVKIINEDLAVGLSSLSFYISRQESLGQNKCLITQDLSSTAV